MPTFIASIGGMLLNLVGSITGRVLVALGFGVVSYTGISSLLDYLKGQVLTSLLSVPPDVLALFGILKIGEFVSLVSSAVAARLLLNGLTSGTFKRFVKK